MVLLFSIALFVSSTLLFLVQPMVGKMILPLLGGTPAVWNTCMVFFQAALLGGYAYAHASVGLLGVRRQTLLHLVLLLGVVLVLPIHLAAGASPPQSDNPIPWLLKQLLVSVGLAFFVVSSSAPLFQRWFVQTGHPHSSDPYFLYGASNLGSLLALLGYPLLVEPNLVLADQSQWWSHGYKLLIGITAICALAVWRASRSAACGTGVSPVSGADDHQPDGCAPESAQKKVGVAGAGVTFQQRLWWIVLSFAPSSLMLGVTTYITTDIAAVPLLWVLPLAIYLLTFVLVFARKPVLSLAFTSKLLPLVLLFWAFTQTGYGSVTAGILIPYHLITFFMAAMVCHGRLAEKRPSAEHLTEFYLWLSVGGVLGGLFNGIVAPLVFHRELEYRLVLVLACLLRPALSASARAGKPLVMDILLPALVAILTGAIVILQRTLGPERDYVVRAVGFFLPVLLCVFFRNRPLRFGLGFAVALAAMAHFIPTQTGTILHEERNFFGVKRVRLSADGQFRRFEHGGTGHGLQSTDPRRRLEPIGYYHRGCPISDVFDMMAERKPRTAIIGLGIGAMAAYAEPGQHFVFYEIDPAVAALAENPTYFTYLADCRGTYEIVLGDGRLSLAAAPDHSFGLFILDAFSSDAIPTHLLSREALQVYLNKLTEDGILAFHVSNRYLNLAPVLGNLARALGLPCLMRLDMDLTPQDVAEGRWASRYVVMARRPEHLRQLLDNPKWQALEGDPKARLWTDQYCNILGILERKQPGR